MAAGAVLLSPQEYKKKLLDFSSGVVSHVKSYYNASLFPSSANSKPSQQPTVPQPSAPLPSETAPSAKSNDYSDVVVMANNNNEEAADKKIEFEPEKEQKIPETSGTVADSASTDNLPPGVLYKVKATYKYQAEDMDELAFEVGEIIDVIEYEDPEEQEEGWLMGVKDSTGQKGLFPANFTKPI